MDEMELHKWSTRYEALEIHQRFDLKELKLSWNARSSKHFSGYGY